MNNERECVVSYPVFYTMSGSIIEVSFHNKIGINILILGKIEEIHRINIMLISTYNVCFCYKYLQ